MKKKGTILVENVIFIILNILFLSILILFLVKQGSGAIVLEQAYSKQISILIDSAKPPMEIKLDMEKGRKLAEEKNINFESAVKITGNQVKVKLSDGEGYTYSFFNDVSVTSSALKDNKGEYTGMYLFTIKSKGVQNNE
ncbi:MAG: hypothetical protein ACP5NZ_03850 [Nanobdellota archaeon]